MQLHLSVRVIRCSGYSIQASLSLMHRSGAYQALPFLAFAHAKCLQ